MLSAHFLPTFSQNADSANFPPTLDTGSINCARAMMSSLFAIKINYIFGCFFPGYLLLEGGQKKTCKWDEQIGAFSVFDVD